MEAERAGRKLTAILAADVAGYSRLVGADDEGTLTSLILHRRELLDPCIAKHRGRIIKTTGDGLLAEFASVVDAVRCAVEVQEGMAGRNANVSPDKRLDFRIGVNFGDVIEQDGDIFGDGVNIAARLEALAEPGSICVSERVHEDARGKVGADFEDLGERALKNITRPVRVYRLRPSVSDQTEKQRVLPVLDKPSIAVLPFDNLSSDPQQLYFSDGITEDVITELSRFRSLFVIARNSSFAFRGRQIGIAEIGRQLGVQYVLEGSVRKAQDRVRITAQLIEIGTSRHLWAERYDRDLADIFAVQDEVVSAIVSTIAGRLETAAIEQAKLVPTASMAAYDCLLRGMEFLAGYDAEADTNAISMFEKAVELDPTYAIAHAYLGLALYVKGIHSDQDDYGLALAEAKRAVALDPNDSRCQRILGEISLECRQFERADFHSGRSLALNQNDAHAAAFRAYILAYLGRAQEGIEWILKAMRLNPFYPDWYRENYAKVLHNAAHYAEAVEVYEQLPQPRFYHHAYMAGCYAKLGDASRARSHAEKAMAMKPDFSAAHWIKRLPFARESDRVAHLQELIAAGLP